MKTISAKDISLTLLFDRISATWICLIKNGFNLQETSETVMLNLCHASSEPPRGKTNNVVSEQV